MPPGSPRRPDAATFSRVLGDPVHAQQADDVLCAWTAARARDLRPGMRKHLRADGKALRGAARGGTAPMLLSALWDDGTTAARLPVNTKKENEIPVFRDLLDKIPPGDLEDAVISADQMHTQRKHAKKIEAAGAYFLFTIGGNQEKLFDAADELPWRDFAGEAWTVDRGHGRIDARTIKTLPPTARILKKWPQVRQVFLVERYSYATDGELLGAVAVPGITSLPRDQAGAADLLAYLRGHWAIEVHHYARRYVPGRHRRQPHRQRARQPGHHPGGRHRGPQRRRLPAHPRRPPRPHHPRRNPPPPRFRLGQMRTFTERAGALKDTGPQKPEEVAQAVADLTREPSRRPSLGTRAGEKPVQSAHKRTGRRPLSNPPLRRCGTDRLPPPGRAHESQPLLSANR
jgi:predicted transposase YbfD/YdcC